MMPSGCTPSLLQVLLRPAAAAGSGVHRGAKLAPWRTVQVCSRQQVRACLQLPHHTPILTLHAAASEAAGVPPGVPPALWNLLQHMSHSQGEVVQRLDAMGHTLQVVDSRTANMRRCSRNATAFMQGATTPLQPLVRERLPEQGGAALGAEAPNFPATVGAAHGVRIVFKVLPSGRESGHIPPRACVL